LKKPNFARVEVLHARTGKVIATLIGDGDYFWKHRKDGRLRHGNKQWQNVYMREPAEGYSIVQDATLLLMRRPVIDPSIFGTFYEKPWWQTHMDGVRRVGTEKVGSEECEVIEVRFLHARVSHFLWLSKVDHLPRKLKEVVLSSRLGDSHGSITHEIWTNVNLNADIPAEKFLWQPPPSWRIITRSTLRSREHAEGLSDWIEAGYFNEEDNAVVHYMIYVPRSYTPDKSFPLVVAMPGYPYGRRSFMDSGISKFAESRRYIVVCPEACPKERGHRWIVRVRREVILILSEMKEKYNIDAKRVYIMGQSNGGFAAYYIGFYNSELFAGIASCSGAIGSKIELLPRMAKSAKEFIPVYIGHGAKDRVIPVSRARYMLHQLKKLGYECHLQIYPEGGHYVIRDDMKNIFDFFNKHAKQQIPESWKRLKRKRRRRN